MSLRTDNDILSVYNDLLTGLFKDNVSFLITPAVQRLFVSDIVNSKVSLYDFEKGQAPVFVIDGSNYNIDFKGKRIAWLFGQISTDINVNNPVSPKENSIVLAAWENTSGISRSVNFATNSYLLSKGNVNASQVIQPGQTGVFIGIVDASNNMRWAFLGAEVTGGFTVGDLDFNPAVDQTYTASATMKSYPQSGAIAITADLTGAENGAERVYQIVGDGGNITFDSNFVYSDDGTTAVSTINYTGPIKIFTYYNKSTGKIEVDTPILGGGAVSSLGDLTDVDFVTAPATNTSKSLRLMVDLAKDGLYKIIDWTPGPSEFGKRTVTASGALVEGDLGLRIKHANASNISLSVPDGLPDGWYCLIDTEGTGETTITGTDVKSEVGSAVKSRAQWTTMEVRSNGGNVTVVTGGIQSA